MRKVKHSRSEEKVAPKPQKQKPFQPKVRNFEMLAMHERGGKGSHGGGKRQQNRRDRSRTKLDLRRGDF